MSRPNMSVPSRCSALPPSSQAGGRSLSGSACSMGEYDVSSGAPSAIKTSSVIMSNAPQGRYLKSNTRGSRVSAGTLATGWVSSIVDTSGITDARINVGIQDIHAEGDEQHQRG